MIIYLNIWHGAEIVAKEKFRVKAFESEEEAKQHAKGGEPWYIKIALPVDIGDVDEDL